MFEIKSLGMSSLALRFPINTSSSGQLLNNIAQKHVFRDEGTKNRTSKALLPDKHEKCPKIIQPT